MPRHTPIILTILLSLISCCGGYKPPIVTPPDPIPIPELSPRDKLAQDAFGTKALKQKPGPEIIDVWSRGSTPSQLKALRDCCTTAEIIVDLDRHWDDRILDSPKAAWEWLNVKREWIGFDSLPACPYVLPDVLWAMQYGGIKLELNFDTHNNRPGMYHRGRVNKILADDKVYAKAARHILVALRNNDITIDRVWIENEPTCCAGRVQEFTLNGYLSRVTAVKAMRDKLFPGMEIGAGSTSPEWGVEAWHRRLADKVGFHVIFNIEKHSTLAQEQSKYRSHIQQFINAGVPKSRIIADECLSPRNIRVGYDETIGKGLAGYGWTTITGDKKCSPSWSLPRLKREKETDNLP